MKREEKILMAVISIKVWAMNYEYFAAANDARSEMALKKLHEYENELYDAIGGMEEYKYDKED